MRRNDYGTDVPTYAILTAAGSGSRLGSDLPKALVPLRGVPLVVHAAQRLGASGVVDAIIVTAPEAHLDQVRAVLAHWNIDAEVVAGGPSRQASVASGLDMVPESASIVLVHDAARALAPADLIARIVREVRSGHDGVIPGMPVTDTIKQVEAGPGAGLGAQRITATVPRNRLCIVQTPQGFRADVLRKVHADAREQALDESTAATDDASLLEAAGHQVWSVKGDERALKITTAHDLAVAGLLLN